MATSPVFATKFTVSLDRDSIILGESVKLTFTFEGASPGGMPQLPAIPGLQLASGMSSGYSSSLGLDGKTQSVQTYSVQLIANQPGEIQIPAFHVELGSEKLSSQPLKLKVLREDPTAPPAEFAGKSAFLWLVLPKQDFYLGEVVAGELRLYVRSEVGNISEAQLPELAPEGFNVSKMVNGQNFQRRVGSAAFTVVPMNFSLTAVKTGTFATAAGTGSVVIHFGPRDFWGNFRQRAQVSLPLEPQTLQVRPLPVENMPAGFNGAVGQYSMTVSVGPTNVATGDPVTVRVQVTGRGNLNGLMLPEQPAWHAFKAYPPTANVETSDPLGLQGAKTFEQIVTPESTDIKELPSLTFSYFDPETKLYRTLMQPAVPLIVRPGGSAPAPVVAASSKPASDTPPPQRDIVPIKPRLGPVTSPGSSFGQQKVFLVLNALPTLALIGAVVWRKRTDALANNPRLRRQRQVAETIRTGLERLRALAAQNQSDSFFAELVHLLQEKLGERLDCPASAITEAVIDEKLRPRGLPDTTLEELHELFQSCNLARYAPIKSSQALAAIIPRLESALKKLEEVRS
ncbi:MAG: BatD family protein [Verrucomicrobiota bacterium]